MLFAALALAAFFLLLRIMTIPRKLPTTADASNMSMTGMRMAQTRGGKSECSAWSSSTKGYASSVSCDSTIAPVVVDERIDTFEADSWQAYHQQGPYRVI